MKKTLTSIGNEIAFRLVLGLWPILFLAAILIEKLIAAEYVWTARTKETGVRLPTPEGGYVIRSPIRGVGQAVFLRSIKRHVSESMFNHDIAEADIEVKFRGRTISYRHENEGAK